MKLDQSDWRFPQDVIIAIIFYISPIIGVMFLVSFFREIEKARRGDMTIYLIAFSLAILGLFFLFFAKYPLYKQGKFFTFGSKELPEQHKSIYRLAYYLLGGSLFIMLLVLAMVR